MRTLKNKCSVKLCFLFLFLHISIIGNGQTVENNALTSFALGQEAFKQDRILDSIRYFQQSISFNVNFADAYREIARSFYFLGETQEAEDYIQRAIELAPQDSTNQTLHARILLSNGRINDARTKFSTVLENDPFNNEAQTGLAELSLAEGNIIQAREYFRDSQELYPEDYRVLVSLAYINRVQGDSAEDFLDIALEFNNQDPWLNFYVSEYYFLDGNYDRAENYAQRSLLLQSNFPPALELLSRIYIQTENFQQAVNFIQQSDSQDLREDSVHLYNRALAEYNTGNSESALRTLATVLRSSPNNEFSRVLFEDILINERGFEDRQRIESSEYHFVRAAEYLERNQHSSAFYHYTRGLQIAPFSVNGRMGYAQYLREQGEYARYLNQIEFISEQLGMLSQNLVDEREIFTDLLQDSVSTAWNVDQFLSERDPFTFALFIIDGIPLEHSFVDRLIGEKFMDILFISSQVDFIRDTSQLTYKPIIIQSYNEAFSTARSEAVDYYIVLRMSEGNRSIELQSEIFLGRTGRRLSVQRVTRSGNTRVKDSLIGLSENTLNSLPLRAKILDRNFEYALINRGRQDSIEQGDSFHIIDPENISLHTSELRFFYNEEDIIGRAEVNRTDEFISQVDIEVIGFFDSINTGDVLFMESAAQSDILSSNENSISLEQPLFMNSSQSLYERIRQIR